MTGERRIYRSDEKLRIVLEGLSGTITVSDLCRKYGIKPANFYYWKNELVKSSGRIFDNRGRTDRSSQNAIEELRGENRKLKDTIAEITTENLELKKKIGDRGVKI
jgi:transposase-like protein